MLLRRRGIGRTLPGLRRLCAAIVALASILPGSVEAASKRKKQDYGVPKPATTPRQVLLWVPRVALFPLYLVSEYAVRKPIGAVVRLFEQDEWNREASNFLSFGARGHKTFYPSVLFDWGVKPSVGFNLGWKNFVAPHNNIRLQFGTWGPDFISLKAVEEYELSPADTLALEGTFLRSRDEPFYGLGARSPSDLRFRFQTHSAEVALGYERRLWRSSRFETHVGFRSRSFGAESCCGEQSLSDGIREGRIPSPPGFGDGYSAEFQRLSVTFDSRNPEAAVKSGVVAEAFGETVFAPASVPESRRAWLSYGAALGAATNIYGSRTLAVKLDAKLSDSLLGPTPFTDRVMLGGDQAMRGYLRNRLIDKSAAVATVQYTWPIWVPLDGVIQADVGNVFGEHFDGFELGLLRLSTSIGIRSNGRRDSRFELLVAGATDPFESGLRYSSFRLVIGSHHGF